MDKKQIFNKFRKIIEPILFVKSYFTIHCSGNGGEGFHKRSLSCIIY